MKRSPMPSPRVRARAPGAPAESTERKEPSRLSSKPGFVGAATALVMASMATVAMADPPQAAAAVAGADATQASAPDRTSCLGAHRAAQELRQSGKLVEASAQLVICSSQSCPGPVISDCGTWIGELEEATPTLVFEVDADGKETQEAKLFVDQEPVTDWSHALKVNPGRHVIRAELPPFEPHEETVIAIEGRRMRLVSIQFASPKAAIADARPTPAAEAPTERRPVPVIVYPLLGAGIVGLAGFGVFGGIGRAKQTSLQQTCAPGCSDSDLQPMKTAYLVGDVAAGVGAAALVSAALFYFTRPTESQHQVGLRSFDVGPIQGVARGDRPWSASATMTW